MRRALCLLCAAVWLAGAWAGPVRRPRHTQAELASRERVDVLIYGVIQFSESLQQVYGTTEAKMAQIRRSLRRHERGLREQRRLTGQAAEDERRLRELLRRLQVQMAELQAEANMTKERLVHVEREEEELNTRVANLERHLDSSYLSSIKQLQERAKLHSRLLNDLQHVTQDQQQKLHGQDQQLSKLQRAEEAMPQMF